MTELKIADETRYREISAGLERVRARIDAVADHPVSLLPVTKFHPISDILILHELGVKEVGENREQEAREKHQAFPQMNYHMIGQIQRKKINSIARWAHVVQSVDSVDIAIGLNRGVELAIERGDRPDGPLNVFVQLSLDGDPDRGGCAAENLDELVTVATEQRYLRLDGLMCVPPVDTDPAAGFATAREIKEGLEKQLGRVLQFSAGMSHDLEIAIKNGSTLVRVGTDILGNRPLA